MPPVTPLTPRSASISPPRADPVHHNPQVEFFDFEDQDDNILNPSRDRRNASFTTTGDNFDFEDHTHDFEASAVGDPDSLEGSLLGSFSTADNQSNAEINYQDADFSKLLPIFKSNHIKDLLNKEKNFKKIKHLEMSQFEYQLAHELYKMFDSQTREIKNLSPDEIQMFIQQLNDIGIEIEILHFERQNKLKIFLGWLLPNHYMEQIAHDKLVDRLNWSVRALSLLKNPLDPLL